MSLPPTIFETSKSLHSSIAMSDLHSDDVRDDPSDGTKAHPNVIPSLDSTILSVFPEIFDEFRDKPFSLLWRGSRDGFGASEFHKRCDGHANTLTVIKDTQANIFGGFTPVTWESRVHNGKRGNEDNRYKEDESETSFIFTLKNPYCVPARKFRLNPEKKHRAIFSWIERGPHFWDIGVYDNCNRNASNNTELHDSYINDTKVNKFKLLTGARYFQVQEIEVFEIIGHSAKVIPLLDSRIVSEFPDIFSEFRGKRFSLLWRGGRDGFGASEFHKRCNGHGNTLTVIEDTQENIFGGFTPVSYES
jgi:hypothetical protein